MTDRRATVVVLAAQRTGVVNPLAEKYGVSHKCLVPICGQPLIHHVLETLTSSDEVARVRISLEPEAHAEVAEIARRFRSQGVGISLVPSQPGIVESVTAAIEDQTEPWIITTADNVLLTHDAIAAMLAALTCADAAVALSTEAAIRGVHEHAQRKYYEFRDGGYANCNLYALAGRHALKAAESFREGGQFMHNPKRLVAAFGLFNILLMRFKLVTIASAMKRISKRFGVSISPVVFADGKLAIDVDNERTYAIVEPLLAARLSGKGPA